jgi:tetratricopeptide (TPR) repeat protein
MIKFGFVSLISIISLFSINLYGQDCSTAEKLHKEAQQDIQAGKMEAGKIKLDSTIQICPQSAYYQTRGLWYYQMSNFREAVKDYTLAIEIRASTEATRASTEAIKSTAELYYLRATAYYWLLDKAKAKADYEKTLQIEANHVEACIGLGAMAEDEEKPKIAFAYYNRAIKAKPSQTLAYLNRGLLYYNQGNTKKALADWNKALAYNPKADEVRILRAELFLEQKKYTQALADIEQIMQQKPYLSLSYLRRGEIFFAQKQTEKACQDWRKAVELGNMEAEKWLKEHCK